MIRSVDLYMCLSEYVFFARVVPVEWIVVPIPLIMSVDPNYTCLDHGIAAGKAGKLRYKNCPAFYRDTDAGRIQNGILLRMADYFELLEDTTLIFERGSCFRVKRATLRDG